MKDLTEQVRHIALAHGADLVGFAPISRFDGAPPELHPRTIYPGTRTVIAMAVRQQRGPLKTIEEGTYWQAYNCDNYWYLNEVVAPALLRQVVLGLEDQGYTSVPVHNPFQPHRGRPVRDGEPFGPDGMISLRIIGVAAGLGELGHSKLLLTPQFGPRQRVFAVFTDAELEPTPLFTGSICDGCQACVRECEAGAIGTSRNVEVRIGDQVYRHAPLDPKACGAVHRGDDPRYSPFWTGSEAPGKGPAYNEFLMNRFRHLSICGGRGCIRACLDHLERTGRIATTFRSPFIERPRWKLNRAPQPPGVEP